MTPCCTPSKITPKWATAGEEGISPPVPKGFVEPNLPFWQNLARLVNYVETGYRKYGLFKGELEEYGTLSRFKSEVAFYASCRRPGASGGPPNRGRI